MPAATTGQHDSYVGVQCTAADRIQASFSPFAAAPDTQGCPELGQMLPTPVVFPVPGQSTAMFLVTTGV